jgi:hypothetical protein
MISPTDAAGSAASGLVNKPVDGEAARGEMNNAASWDDFPNGRFGDYKSPAFGDQGPWGSLGISVRGNFLICDLLVLTFTISAKRGIRTMGSPPNVR